MSKDFFSTLAEIATRQTEVSENEQFAPINSAPRSSEIIGRLPPSLQHLYVFLGKLLREALEVRSTQEKYLAQYRLGVARDVLRLSLEELYPPRQLPLQGIHALETSTGIAKGWQVFRHYGVPIPLERVTPLTMMIEEDTGIVDKSLIPHQRRHPFDVH